MKTTQHLLPTFTSSFFKKLFLLLIMASSNLVFSQQNFLVTPEGVLDKVFDDRGTQYNLSDLMVDNTVSGTGRSALVTCSTTSIFNLYFEPGCGMEDTSNSTHNARRDVLCKVFQDLSDFLTGTGAVLLTTSTTKVNIWVRNINNVYTNPNRILGLGSGFYCLPSSATSGGIVDNEIWKTIHTGSDSYLNLTVPLTPLGASTNQAGFFYHGMVTFNFNDTANPPIANTPAITWNTILNSTSIATGDFDLYSVVLHEAIHALGFRSLIDANGNSIFGPNYRYYSRYDSFLKTNNLTAILTAASSSCSLYDYSLTSGLTAAVFGTTPQPCPDPGITVCSDAIKFVGSTTTVPVYTPSCFSRVSSLSHFEDTHFPTCNTSPPYGDNYFLMCNAGNSGTIRRYLKREERLALCDIGYNVKNTFGVSGANINGNSTSYSYTGDSACGGIAVAGVNDGVTSNGNYTFIYTIGGPNLSISGSSILSNDIGIVAGGGFQCLQDMTGSSSLTPTSGTTASTITFSSGLTGIHLLRYVPVNAGGQKGNITYVYVFVQPATTPLTCNPTPTVCNLVSNGDFEQNVNLPTNASQPIPNDGQFERACGWYRPNVINSPDYNYSNPTATVIGVPCNGWGDQPDRIPGGTGDGYAGIAVANVGGNNWGSEIIATTLSTALQSSTTYQLKFDVSLAELYSGRSAILQAFISSSPASSIIGNLIPNGLLSTGILLPNANSQPNLTNSTFSNTTAGWETITFTFTTAANLAPGMQYLYIGALNNPQVQNRSLAPAPPLNCFRIPNNSNAMYYYIDNVSLIATGGANLNLPDTICMNQTLPNLTTYLSAVPTNGYFTGNGVVLNNGVYSINPTIAGVGTATINYTYSNNSGCLVTLTDTIIVTNNAIVTPTFSFATALCSGATPPTLPNTSNNNVIGIWSPTTVSSTASASYTFTPSIGQCANPVTVFVTVNPITAITSITPSIQTVCLNSTPISFQVNATGSNLTYQWYSNNSNINTGGTLIPTAINAAYTPPTNATGTKYYYVIVNGNCPAVTSSVLTVTTSSGTANAGTLSGTQTFCRTSGRTFLTTVFTATVAGGTWSSSNTALASITSTTSTTATIRITGGPATITYTVTGTNGCQSSATRTITVTPAVIPTFSQFPINPNTGLPDPTILCNGATPPSLPTTSSNGITGTWNPTSINNTTSGGYTFTPTTGLCAESIYQSVIVTSVANFAANNDSFSVNYPLTTVITGSVLTNDTYLGSNLNSVPPNLTYTVTPVGTPPTIPNGGITLNTNGTYTIQPNTTPGTYTYYYKLTTSCGTTATATVQIVINNHVFSSNKIGIDFCFNSSSNVYDSNSSSGNTSLFNFVTVEGQPANSNNATLIYPTLPSSIVIHADGTVTVTSSLPFSYTFNYRVRSTATGFESSDIACRITIKSPLGLSTDNVTYNTSGTPQIAGTFNVLTNDVRNLCNTTNNTITTTALLSGSVTLTGSVTSPAYFKINNGTGIVTVDANVGLNPGTIPVGSYVLNYTVCDNANLSICSTQSLTIYVTNTFRMVSQMSPKEIISKTHQVVNTTFQVINFTDANLKAKLLDATTCFNTTNGDLILADSNGDGEIDTNEATQIGRVNLFTANISNLTGLEYFTNLTSIAIGQNNIGIFNIAFPNLTVISIQNNPLTTFNASILPNLTGFNVSNTLLTSIDTSNNYLLYAVNISNTHINTIDLGASHNLGYLYINNNPNLTSINIKNTSILDYTNSFMQQDCWTNCPNLSYICADSNEIPALQSYLSGCGVNTSGITLNSACALGVDETQYHSFTVYPNPSKGVFTFDMTKEIVPYDTVIVYDVLGKKVYSGILNPREATTINLSGLADGYYTAQLSGGVKSVSVKLIKE